MSVSMRLPVSVVRLSLVIFSVSSVSAGSFLLPCPAGAGHLLPVNTDVSSVHAGGL